MPAKSHARERRQRKKAARANLKHQWQAFAGVGDDAPLWRNFWLVMALAAALRVLTAVTGDWLLRTDELFQYLEQAHRVVFGYGEIPWEFRFGMRSWLLPMMSVPPLWFAKMMDWTSPDIYAPMVRSFHALLSLTVPAGMYLFTRRIHGEHAARVAMIFGAFWHELVVLSPHPTAENTAMVFLFAALMLTTRNPGITARAAIGFFLAMVIVYRVQYAPAAGIAGLLLLVRPPLSANIAMVIAGLAALAAAGAVDYFTWGGFGQSYINYFKLQFSGYTKYTAKPSSALHFQSLMIASAGLFYLALICALFYLRRLWLPMAFFLSVQIPHNIFVGEYTNTLLGVPFVLIIAACVVAEWIVSRAKKPKRGDSLLEHISPRKAAAWFGAAILAVSGLAYGGWLPNQTHMYVFKNPRPLFYDNKYFKVNKAFSGMPEEKVRGIVFLIPGGSAHHFGGYYYTHQNAPMFFPFTNNHDRDVLGLQEEEIKDAQTLFSESGARFASKASHLVMPRGAVAEGFSVVFETERLQVWQNNDIASVTIPSGAVYDIMDNAIVGVLGILDENHLGVISQKDHPLTPFKP